jgi:hypothetical protein
MFSRWFRGPSAPKTLRRTAWRLTTLEDRTAPAGTGLVNVGFEAPALGVGQFRYAPTGSGWSFSGSAGISANASGFTSGNPAAPQGSQVAFIQRGGSVSQAATFTAGSYAISLVAAQRGNIGGFQTFQILVNGQVVGTFNNVASTAYTQVVSTSFNLTAGSHTVTIQGTNLNGGDNTIFIDNVTVVPQVSGLADVGFERPPLVAGSFGYRPTGGPWTFNGTAGLAANGSGFTFANAPAPQGNQVLFLQGTGSVSQSAVFAAGTYRFAFNAAQRANGGGRQTFTVSVNGRTLGTFNNLTGGSYSTLNTSTITLPAGTHTITLAGTNLVGGDNTAFVDNLTVIQEWTSLADSGFEFPAVAAGSFRYNPTGGSWTFTGTSGVATNGSGFTAANPLAPQGNQVLFLQGTGGASQVVNFPAGTYTMSFFAAQRANGGGRQTFNILIDGKVHNVVNDLAGTGYTSVLTTSFNLTAGNHTITFQGTNLNGGDNTAFVDQVEIVRTPASVADTGFELPSLPNSGYRYNPTGSAWTFVGSAGLAANGSPFTASNPAAPQGRQVAFIQRNGSFRQVANFAAGAYSIQFAAAQRAFGSNFQTVQVLVDGKVVGSFNSISGTNYVSYATSTFNLTAGDHTITFQGTNLATGDNTVLIDQIEFIEEPSGLADSGFESPGLNYGAFQYAPTTSAWKFAGTAGIAADGSAFVAGNGPAAQGGQVAFLQQTGSFSQTVTFAAGTYDISFFAAQRRNVPSAQTFRVLVNGQVVGIFNGLSATQYVSLVTDTFTLTAGNHTITFQGTNLIGGDNTVLLDQITITRLF